MFSIVILADEAREAYGTPEGLEKLDRLSEIAKDRMVLYGFVGAVTDLGSTFTVATSTTGAVLSETVRTC